VVLRFSEFFGSLKRGGMRFQAAFLCRQHRPFPSANLAAKVGKRRNGVDVHPFNNRPARAVVRSLARARLKQLVIAQRCQPRANLPNLFAQACLLLGKR